MHRKTETVLRSAKYQLTTAANITLTNIILQADKHHIQKSKMHKTYQLIPGHISHKIKLIDTTQPKKQT